MEKYSVLGFLGADVCVSCFVRYSPAEPETSEHLGCPAKLIIDNAYVGDCDILSILTDGSIADLTAQFLEKRRRYE